MISGQVRRITIEHFLSIRVHVFEQLGYAFRDCFHGVRWV